MVLSPIINVQELLAIRQQKEVKLFDVSSGKEAKNNFEKEHLEGARWVDLNTQLSTLSDNAAYGGRHPLPSLDKFASVLSTLGVEAHDHIVVYDDKAGANAAARFWWMLRAIGVNQVQVLNGGFQHAKMAGFPLCSTLTTMTSDKKPMTLQRWNLPMASITEVEEVTNQQKGLIIDVRERARYEGLHEPIDVIAGHIPGAINLPYTDNLDENNLFLPPEVLKQKYQAVLSANPSDKVIVHCGSGVTACHTILAMAYAGLPIPRLYVGSWSEWSRNNKAIETTIPMK